MPLKMPASIALSMLVTATVAGAASSEPDTSEPPSQVTVVETITVSAEKRETDLQETPVAVTALSSDDLERSNVEGFESLQFQVPNMIFGVVNADTQISLRGIGNENITPGGDPGVALHLDGVYLGRSSAAFVDFLDLDRVEVLRGPQGTLYGRNTTGGSINLFTRGPSRETRGRLDLGFGSDDRLQGEGSLGGPLLPDTLFGQISVAAEDREGFHENIFDGSTLDDRDYTAIRGKLEVAFSPRSALTLSAYRHDEGGAGAASKNLFDGIEDLRVSARDFPQSQDNDYQGLAATFVHTSARFELTSLTSVYELRTDLALDTDATAQPIQNVHTVLDADQLSQELRLASTSGGPGQWQVGLFYFEEDAVSDFDLSDAFFGPFTIDSVVDTTSLAIFGRYSHDLGSKARLFGGLRYNSDEKEATDRQFLPAFGLDLFLPQEDSWDEVTGDLGFDLELSPRSFFYAKYSRGYKSGGFNLPGDGLPYDPEFVNAYEVGLKNLLADNRVRLNAALFHYDYDDMQVFQIRNFQTLIENAAESTIDGLEVEMVARPVAGNLVQANIAWLDAEYDSFTSVDPLNPLAGVQNLAGNRLNRAPRLSFNVAVQHSFSIGDRRGSLSPRAELYWQDEIFFRQFNLEAESQGSYTRSALRLLWDSPRGRYQAQAWVENLEDEDVIGNMLINATNLSAFLLAPRTTGASFGIRF